MSFKHFSKTVLLACVVGIGAVGCSGGTGAGGESTGAQGTAETISRTIVHLDAHGKPTVTTELISKAEQELEKSNKLAMQQAAKASGEKVLNVVLDTGCSGSSDWLFNESNETGNEICRARGLVGQLRLGRLRCQHVARCRRRMPEPDRILFI
jgi:hypothetical protein